MATPHSLPLLMNVWAPQVPVAFGALPVGAPASMNVPCDLQQCRFSWSGDQLDSNPAPQGNSRYIYSGKQSPVALNLTGATYTYIELPAGSGTIYWVYDIQDVNKGTTSEQRRLVCNPWRFPNPLP